MKRLLLIAVALVTACNLSRAVEEEEEKQNPNIHPDAGGIVLEPSSGKIGEGDQITITFPVSMVPDRLIDVDGQPAPFVSQPRLEGTFLWKSETEGVFTVTGVVADAHHRLTLATGLKDAAGKPFLGKEWRAEFRAPKFTLNSDFRVDEDLPVLPQM